MINIVWYFVYLLYAFGVNLTVIKFNKSLLLMFKHYIINDFLDQRIEQPSQWLTRKIVSIRETIICHADIFSWLTLLSLILASNQPWRKSPNTKTNSLNCKRKQQNSTSETNWKLSRKRSSPWKKKTKRSVDYFVA